MKINLEVDCTPEEARRAMGLPDLSPVHDKYIATLTDAMDGRGGAEALDAMTKSWGPMGDASMTFWRGIFEAAGRRGD
jgi:hypothetical protein